MAEIPWTIKPGDIVLRSALHDTFGGGRQGGMEPSAKSPNVFLFTSKSEGAKYGYDFDGWHPDGTFHYTGEGTVGDQVMKNGNRVTRDHLEEGRALRLFEKAGTSVIYIGEFSVPDESHVLLDEAPDVNQTDLRAVFVFRLKPIGETWEGPVAVAPAATLAMSVPIEATHIDKYIQQRQSSEPVISLRSEAELVKKYVKWLESRRGATVERQAIPTPGGHLMYTDVFVIESQELIEAKSSSSRHHIRAALGQILDYARYVQHSKLAILTPTEPEPAMVELLHSYGVSAIWEAEVKGEFVSKRITNVWKDAP